ncbi:uncharacterized protein E0L32_007094 [Thyridium curvatum]|uniref:AB hydrolase-1 domain-containing protein n=1 Tax=Thyridium curvatum TaxID=1093900 RepID=A0A507B5T5_9PEZI|nr:uncharacterized protein E0L32_007094 [Thyridium curvatum]TPX12208.1 hypothetical protein E0L32_007094 [Thyridium curvatum]
MAPLLLVAAATGKQTPAIPLTMASTSGTGGDKGGSQDPRIRDLGREIADEYAQIRKHYDAPRHPIVLAHGLLGFSELRLAGDYLPAIQYWHGIQAALEAQGARVITASVPPSGTIEQRAAKLSDDIAAAAAAEDDTVSSGVNIVAHSMGGLDARYMASRLRPRGVRVRSVVTVATPHHGSAFADYLIDEMLGPANLRRAYALWERTTGFGTGAFAQLTRRYMEREFNPATPDDPAVRYFSYGAMVRGRPPLFSPFRQSHRVIEQLEGPNDGLVSVQSSKWGAYKGTLVDVSHLDLINWSNRLRWAVKKWMGQDKMFNAIAFYLDIADMLAKEGL